MQNWFINILFVVAIIVIGGVGYLMLNKDVKISEEVAVEQKTEVVEKDKTADWETYRSEKLGFEMKIPKGYVKEDPYGVAELPYMRIFSKNNISGKKEFTIELQRAPGLFGDKSVSCVDSLESDDGVKLIGNIFLDNEIAYIFKGKGYIDYVYVQKCHNDLQYKIQFLGEQTINKENNQILSTFKFID